MGNRSSVGPPGESATSASFQKNVFLSLKPWKQSHKADIITMGPGSLYTSLLPNLLVKGIPDAIRQSTALKVYIGNIMTQKGETVGFTASDHLRAIREHCGDDLFSYFLCNNRLISEEQRASYRREAADQTKIDVDAIGEYGVQVMFKDLLAEGDKVRHDSMKLAAAIFELALSAERIGFDANPVVPVLGESL